MDEAPPPLEEPDAEARASLFEPAAQGGADLFLAGQHGGGVHSRSPLPGDAELGQAQASSSASAEAFSVLVGMQPLFRQVPPRFPLSTRVTDIPARAAAKAAVYPPGPPPMTVRRMGMARLLVLVAFEIQIVFHREGRFERAVIRQPCFMIFSTRSKMNSYS